MSLSSRMYREAAQAPEVVREQLKTNAATVARIGALLREMKPHAVVTCARGSSDNAATFAKYLIETHAKVLTSSAAPSLSSLYEAKPDLRGVVFIAISQSGKSPDLLRNAEIAKSAGAQVVALVNVADSPLAQLADTVIPLHAGPENSVAATKSYLCSLAALLQLTARWSGDTALLATVEKLPDALREAWKQDWSPLVSGLRLANNLFVLGRGLGLAAAQEAALKFKETCGLHAEAFSAAEVRHGPMALVGEGFPVLVFAQADATFEHTLAVATELRNRGARVWLAAPGAHGTDALPLPADVPAITTPLLAVQSLYRAVSALALARGYDPDLPPHLRKVTETL
jgi:glutamine---fructose-6-phosphate transaminase (isomerizing)